MNLLVTGGAGFIGSEFVKQVVKEKNLDIYVIDSLTYAGKMKNIELLMDRIRFERLDIRDDIAINKLFYKYKFDLIVNFAAESHVDRSISNPKIFLETNIIGTQVLLEAAIKYNSSRFLQISTDEVYGSLISGIANEDSVINPSSAYSASKASAEHFVGVANQTFGLNTGIVRCSNNYGPRQFPEKLIPFFISKIVKHEKVPLYGNGDNIREWLHVSDCVNGIIKVLFDGQPNEIYNISSSSPYSNLEVATLLLQFFQLKSDQIEFVEDRKGHDFRYAIDSSKILRELDWKPTITFNDGLKSTVKWYLDNLWALNQFSAVNEGD
jgi:dTDP-glucose 4,6-dehydratase